MKRSARATCGSALASLALLPVTVTADASVQQACWGQATKVFAATGEMGPHSAGQATPRVGLRNLARTLADAGIIPDDSMASLGVFVSDELGLTIDACA
jgi:hypothetical protein